LDEHFANGTGGNKFDLAGRHSAYLATRGGAAGTAIRSGVGLALQDHRRSRRWQNEFAKRACRFPVSAKSGLLRLFPSLSGHGGWQALTRTDPKGIHNFAQLPLARYTVATPGYIEAKGIPLRTVGPWLMRTHTMRNPSWSSTKNWPGSNFPAKIHSGNKSGAAMGNRCLRLLNERSSAWLRIRICTHSSGTLNPASGFPWRNKACVKTSGATLFWLPTRQQQRAGGLQSGCTGDRGARRVWRHELPGLRCLPMRLACAWPWARGPLTFYGWCFGRASCWRRLELG
jgi:hypothetical protein